MVVTPVAEAAVLQQDPYLLFYVAWGLESVIGNGEWDFEDGEAGWEM